MVTRTLFLIATALTMTACHGDGNGTNPAEPTQTATQPAPTTISQAAAAYLSSLLTIMETDSTNKAVIDWSSVRADVFAAAGVAQSIPDTYPGIAVAIRRLNDYESYYAQARGGATIGTSPVGQCGAQTAPASDLQENVGYVRVGSCNCDGPSATQFAESIQRTIAMADRPGLAGWIVDLRGNIGGNMWPMIAGVGPVLGEGIIGWIVYNNREYEREYRDGAAQSFGEVFAQVKSPYRLLKEYPRVAVLTDGAVVSAGEAVAVYFKGRSGTRSFGTPTCGHHHLLQDFRLSDGAVLFLVTAKSADRTKKKYGGPIEPDEMVTNSSEVFNRAVGWLKSGS